MVGGIAEAQQNAGTGQYLHQVEDRRAIKVRSKNTTVLVLLLQSEAFDLVRCLG